jgi:phosphonate metabolism protein PhnN/1,5-bisphosphokinase (PRPP-forming)
MDAPAAPSRPTSADPVAAGRFVLVVGPSGAGKDTLIDAAREALAADPRFVFPRRVVTRPASPAEDHHVADETGFLAHEAQGGFALSWGAHGHRYGIPATVLDDLTRGRTVVVNVSRTVIGETRRRWPGTLVIEVTAPDHVLAARIAARARPSDAAGKERLARRLDTAADVVIDNGDDLAVAISAFVAAISAPRPASKPRHAVYFAPAVDGDLWRLASRVIGRDAVTGEALPFPDAAPCDAADWSALTDEPRRYGFHATLKAPFELADGTDEALLIDAARAFAAERRGFTVADLSVRAVKTFVALTPDARNAELDRLAADCVVAFEPFRAPLSPQERARRVKSLSDPAHVASVDRWGYPWVFEDFRFHMTLTGPVPDVRRDSVAAGLAALFRDVARPLRVDAIAVFRQDHRAAPFRIVARLPFSA